MAVIPISAYPAAAGLTGAELLPVVQAGATKKLSLSTLLSWLLSKIYGYRVLAGFLETPGAAQLLQMIVFDRDVIFPANWSDNVSMWSGAAPGSVCVIRLKRVLAGQHDEDGLEVGQLSISTARVVTRTSKDGLAITFPAGSALQVWAPVTPVGGTNYVEMFRGDAA